MRDRVIVMLCASLVACGSDPISAVPDSSVTDASPDVVDATSPTPDASSSDSAPSDASTLDVSSTPGLIECGGATCNLTTQVCCIRLTADAGADGGPGFARTCEAVNACKGPDDVASTCDERADCPNGQVCCMFYNGGGLTILRAACQATCPGGNQFCRTAAECTTDGGVCAGYTCPGNPPLHSCFKPLQSCN